MTQSTTRLFSCLAMAFVVSTAAAQETQVAKERKFAPRDFMIPNYENLMFADIKLMRDREVWDELESSAVKLFFKEMERELGFSIDDLDRVTASMAFGPIESGGMTGGPVDTVRILEGNKPLPVHQSMAGTRWQSEQLGEFKVWRRKSSSEDVFVQPCDSMQVWGTSAALLPALEKRRVAVPSAEVMSFLSGRDATLACFVFGLNHPQTKKRFLDSIFEGAEWPQGDAPQMLGVRLLATGDEDDPHLTIEAMLRHKKAGDGIKVTERLTNGLLDKVNSDRQMLMVRRLLKDLEKEVDGTDMVLRLDLGRVRNAVGNLAMFAVPLLMGGQARAAEVRAQQVEVEVLRARAVKAAQDAKKKQQAAPKPDKKKS